jgi:predicted DsbA family dithiol-disulfide isomerase
MRERLFATQSRFAERVWLRAALDLGLNIPDFERCLEGSTIAKIRADIADGTRLGVSATPTFLIGRLNDSHSVRILTRIRGSQPYAAFEDQLKRAGES